ncbi:MAG: type II toxin-antitoxin system Phd/YefM family antitoxin [Gammaproteobacteria bacterium]
METMIGIYDAKSSFSALLEKVARGERFIITNRGAPVAMLVPIEEARSGRAADDISSLFAEMKALRQGVTLGGISVRELVDEGRRF